MRRLALVLALALLLVGAVSALDGYDYYQEISYGATDVATYQQDVVVHRSVGTDYEETAGGLKIWHIYVGGHCREDYGDVRFTNSTGAELACYLWPDFNADGARFGVRLEGADSAGTLTVHYGNASATTTSDGDGAYLLYDHFEGSALNSLKWEVLQNNGISVSDGALHISSGTTNYGALASLAQIQSDILIQFRIQTRTYATSLGVGNTDLSGVGSSIGLVYYDNYESAIYTGPIYNGRWAPPRTWTTSSTDGDVITAPPAGYFVEEFAIPEGGYLKQRRNGGAWTTSTRYTGVSGSHPIQITHYRGYAGMDLDYILVRAYSATPPAALTFSGEQETAAPPTAAFTATPTAGLAPLIVQFTDTSAGSPTSWAWTFGDSGTSTAQNPQHTYTEVGTYTVTLTATNEYGTDSETKTNYIDVGDPPAASFTPSPSHGYAPLTVQFTDTSTYSPTSWSWTFGDGTTSTAQSPTHTYTEVGTYTVTLTATNAYGQDSATTTVTASTIYPFPTITANPTDIDADGIYEDINGNGRLDFNDLTIFFKNLAWAKTNEPIEAFDFNGNGWLDYKDVTLLFNEIKEASA